jgi:hypothetical protein
LCAVVHADADVSPRRRGRLASQTRTSRLADADVSPRSGGLAQDGARAEAHDSRRLCRPASHSNTFSLCRTSFRPPCEESSPGRQRLGSRIKTQTLSAARVLVGQRSTTWPVGFRWNAGVVPKSHHRDTGHQCRRFHSAGAAVQRIPSSTLDRPEIKARVPADTRDLRGLSAVDQRQCLECPQISPASSAGGIPSSEASSSPTGTPPSHEECAQ